jgi:hypothetical protein
VAVLEIQLDAVQLGALQLGLMESARLRGGSLLPAANQPRHERSAVSGRLRLRKAKMQCRASL